MLKVKSHIKLKICIDFIKSNMHLQSYTTLYSQETFTNWAIRTKEINLYLKSFEVADVGFLIFPKRNSW
jgi:hypothetical protein